VTKKDLRPLRAGALVILRVMSARSPKSVGQSSLGERVRQLDTVERKSGAEAPHSKKETRQKKSWVDTGSGSLPSE
jgi:hypothetical protein